jgi:hypothetical protein
MNYMRLVSHFVLSAAVLVSAAEASNSRANAADMATKAPPLSAPGDVNSSVVWLGGDFKNDVAAGNIGGIYAFSGNLDASGWLVRGQFSYVGYDFNTTLSASGTANGRFSEGSGALGYQVVGGGWVASGFVGVDGQNYNIDPPAAATAGVGDKAGAIFFGRIATMGGAPYPISIDGDYSTANDSFWVRGRTGVKFTSITVGPEIIGLGNVAFDEVRAGGYVSFDLSRSMILQADLGYANATRGENSSAGRGGSGAYGGVTLVFLH